MSPNSWAWSLLPLGIAVALVAFLALLPPREKPRSPVGSALTGILNEGPGPGRWRLETIDGVGTWHVHPLPDDDHCVLVFEETEDEELGSVERWSKQVSAHHFAPGDERLFLRNYRLVGEPEREGDLVIARWVPRHEFGGDTSRTLWMDADSGAVVHLEDQSFHEGDIVRSLDREGDPAPLPAPPPDTETHMCPGSPRPGPRPSTAKVAASTPPHFVLLEPLYVPPGFELVRAGYYSLPVLIESEETEENQTREIHVAYLTYSDGLARIGLAVAPPADMDAFEAAQARKPHNPDACPALPRSGGPVKTEGLLVRRRYSRCRTVLRIDTTSGMSVTLIARNELPQDEYVDMIVSVEPVEPVAREE